ncbi:MAG TPA: type II toxin-antitoxin system RelE/ParE family toxin [Pirellulales bacterium]|nr:type II toxin-antitoxin system RelE/ParE family toxin [Pirellulales bacterium]
MATVVLTPEAAEQLDALPNPIHGRVLRLIVRLEQWPNVSGAKPLSGKLAGRWRMRTGDYRVQFRPERNDAADGGWLVVVEKIGHRDRFY